MSSLTRDKLLELSDMELNSEVEEIRREKRRLVNLIWDLDSDIILRTEIVRARRERRGYDF